MQPSPDNLTPGVIDGYARRAFKYGGCGGLAIALHDAMGWPIMAVTDSHNIYGEMAGGGSALHWAVLHPCGELLDIDGLHSPEDLIAEYEGDADNGEAGVGRSTRADAWEWYGESQGEPIPISLAATFVPATLALADQQLAERRQSLDAGMEP